MLHVICTRLRPGHLSVRVGDSSRRCEEIVKKSRIAPLNANIIIIIIRDTQPAPHHSSAVRGRHTDLHPVVLVVQKLVGCDVVGGVLKSQDLHGGVDDVFVLRDADPSALTVGDVRHLTGQSVVHVALAEEHR